MSQLLELEIDIMYVMWTKAQSSESGYTRKEIFELEKRSKNEKIGSVGQRRVDVAIDELRKRCHIEDFEISEDSEVIYRITPRGIEWLEDWYRVTKEGSTFWFHRRREGPVIVNQTWEQRQASLLAKNHADKMPVKLTDPHTWTKWGTILTGLSIIVAIILAVVI